MKMKKFLSLVLSASMVFGSAGYAMAAPKDVEGTKYETAVNRLAALEILNGYEDGTFKPAKTITRAEFAKVMASTLGVGEAAKYAMGETKFNDVPASHWAAGYINVVSDMKVINGRGDGNFGPNDNVTYAEAVTMIVRALGYEPKAKAMGGYPGGYIAVAAEKDVTEDVSVVNSLAANRGDVAIMVENSLSVDMMEQTEYGNNPTWEEKKGKTLLNDKHDIVKVKDFVKAIPKTDDSLDDNQMKVGNTTYDMMIDVDFDSLLGLKVELWTNDDDEVFYVKVKTDEQDILYDTMTIDKTKNEITLEVEDETYDLAKDEDGDVEVEVTINFDKKATLSQLKETEDYYGYYVLDDKGDIRAINVIDADEVEDAIVYKVDGDVYKYVMAGNDSEEELDFSDYEDGVVVYDKNFKEIDKDEIDVNTYMIGFKDKDDDLDKLYLFVANEKVEGELERVRADEFKIAGKKYDAEGKGDKVTFSTDALDDFEIFNKNDITKIDDLNGEEVVAVLDLSGDVVLLHGDVEATSGSMYGIVTYGDSGSKSAVTVFDKDGNDVDYKFEKRSEGTELDGLQYFGKTDATDVAKRTEYAIMKFKLNSDGEIAEEESAILKVDEDGTSPRAAKLAGKAVDWKVGTVEKKADKNAIKVGGNTYYLTKDSVIMTAIDDKELDPGVLTYTSIYESDIDLTDGYKAVVIGEAGKDADMVVFLDENFEGADDDYFYGIVTDTTSKKGDDYVATLDIAGVGEKELIIEDTAAARSALSKEGAVVQFKYNTKGEMDVTLTTVGDADYRMEDNLTTGQTADYDDGYVEIYNGTTLVKSIKVADDVVIYKTDDTDAAKRDLDGKTSASKIDKYETVHYIVDADDIVKAIVVEDEKNTGNTPVTPPTTGVTGMVEAVNSEGTGFLIAGDTYTVNGTTVLVDETGASIELGGTKVLPLIKGYNVTITVKNDIVTKIVKKDTDFKVVTDLLATCTQVEADYTTATWAPFATAKTEAQAIDKTNSPAEVTAAKVKLETAISGLVKTDAKLLAEEKVVVDALTIAEITQAWDTDADKTTDAVLAAVKTKVDAAITVTGVTSTVTWDAKPVVTNAGLAKAEYTFNVKLDKGTDTVNATVTVEVTFN